MNSTVVGSTLLVFAVVLAGCGDDDSGGGGGASCAQVCAKVEAAECANDSDCMSTCNGIKDSTPMGCTGSYSALTTCYASATFTCDADEESVAEGCSKQESAYAECLQSGGADDGEKDAGGGVDEVDNAGSGGDDGDNAGSGGDDMGNAGAGAADSCSGLTVGGECGECLEGSCCDELLACQDDSDCPALTDCVSTCNDSSCQQACADSSTQSAVDLYNGFIDCATQYCETECTDGSSSGGSEDVGEPNDGNGGHASATTPSNCLQVPEDSTGYCGEVMYKVIYDCPDGPPYADCELNMIDANGIYCCGH